MSDRGFMDDESQLTAKLVVERLGALATYVDRLSAKFPLKEHPGLRAQMRRAAMDGLSNGACCLEAVPGRDHRILLLRSLGAVSELETFSRQALQSGAVTTTEAEHLSFMVHVADQSLRADLGRTAPRADPGNTAPRTDLGRTALAFCGAA